MTTKRFAKIAMIAAIYVVISVVLSPFSYGPIQVRISEALTMLLLIYEPAIPALTIGCLITNIAGTVTGVTGPIDIFVGTLATFLAAVCTHRLRDRKIGGIPVLSILMPVIFNAVFVGLELAWMLNPDNILQMSLVYGMQVGIGELISVIIGYLLVCYKPFAELFTDKD